MKELFADLIVQRFASQKEWLEGRRAPDTIGASEAAMALGVSPYATAWSLWQSKREQIQHTRATLDVFARGHRWEPSVLAEYEDTSGHRVVPMEDLFGNAKTVILAHPSAPWLRQTPDGFAVDTSGSLGQVEAKTALNREGWSPEPGIVIDRWQDAYKDIIPPHIAVQCYVQLACTGLPWVDATALVPKNMWLTVRYVRLLRDADTQGEIIEALGHWRQKHLIEGEPPPIDGSKPCNRYLTKMFPSGGKRDEREATPEEEKLMRELAAAKAALKQHKFRAAVLTNRLIALAQGDRIKLGPGKKDPYGQPQSTGSKLTVSVADLRKEAPQLVEKLAKRSAESTTFKLYRFAEEEIEEHDDE